MAQILTGIYPDKDENKENMKPQASKMIDVGTKYK